MSDTSNKTNDTGGEPAMRKLIESTLVSLDGVIESPERWAIFDEEATRRSMQELDNYDAFVMGRVTYERFRENWSASGGNPYFDRISATPKYNQRPQGPAGKGPDQVRHQPPRRHALSRGAD